MKFIRGRASDESGQKYGLLISLVLLATLTVAAGYHNSIAGISNTVGSNLAAGEMLTSKEIKRAVPNQMTLSRRIEMRVRRGDTDQRARAWWNSHWWEFRSFCC